MLPVIKLRKLYSPARLSWHWVAATVEDGDMLGRLGAKRNFSDSEYDTVLTIVSGFGFALETPREEE